MKEFFRDMKAAFERDGDFRVLLLSIGMFIAVIVALIYHVVFD